jgi:hypothetical protein
LTGWTFGGPAADAVTLTFTDQSGATFCGAALDAVSVKQTP